MMHQVSAVASGINIVFRIIKYNNTHDFVISERKLRLHIRNSTKKQWQFVSVVQIKKRE
jgi:hypothetical protein